MHIDAEHSCPVVMEHSSASPCMNAPLMSSINVLKCTPAYLARCMNVRQWRAWSTIIMNGLNIAGRRVREVTARGQRLNSDVATKLVYYVLFSPFRGVLPTY